MEIWQGGGITSPPEKFRDIEGLPKSHPFETKKVSVEKKILNML